MVHSSEHALPPFKPEKESGGSSSSGTSQRMREVPSDASEEESTMFDAMPDVTQYSTEALKLRGLIGPNESSDDYNGPARIGSDDDIVCEEDFTEAGEDTSPKRSDVDIDIKHISGRYPRVTQEVREDVSGVLSSSDGSTQSQSNDSGTDQFTRDLRTSAKRLMRNRHSSSSKIKRVNLKDFSIAPDEERLAIFCEMLGRFNARSTGLHFDRIVLKPQDVMSKYYMFFTDKSPANFQIFLTRMYLVLAKPNLSHSEYLAQLNNNVLAPCSEKDMAQSKSDSGSGMKSMRGFIVAALRCFAYTFDEVRSRSNGELRRVMDAFWMDATATLL